MLRGAVITPAIALDSLFTTNPHRRPELWTLLVLYYSKETEPHRDGNYTQVYLNSFLPQIDRLPSVGNSVGYWNEEHKIPL